MKKSRRDKRPPPNELVELLTRHANQRSQELDWLWKSAFKGPMPQTYDDRNVMLYRHYGKQIFQ